MAHIIVLGNENGGSGKSTTAMHVATALARMGHVVGGLDLDLRQRSFARYIENRSATIATRQLDIAAPELLELPEIDAGQFGEGENSLDKRLAAAVATL